MTTPLRNQILTTLALYRQLPRPKLVAIVASHDLTTSHELIEFCLQLLVEEGAIGMQLGVSHWQDEFFHLEKEEIPELDWQAFDRAARIGWWRMLPRRIKRFLRHPFRTIHQAFRKTKNEGDRK